MQKVRNELDQDGFVDLSDALDKLGPKLVFYDSHHLSASGNRAVAQAILEKTPAFLDLCAN